MTASQKDIIYIDVDDDITAIIGKLKDAKHNIVALVPPKRTGVLQSAVNLRLLARASEQNGKKLVLITGNQSLSALAAAAKIPVAKNLQTKPEIGEIAALEIDDGEEVIDGASLPVGEHARQPEDSSDETSAAIGAAAVTKAKKGLDAKGKKPAVPNFDVFRKKLFIIGVAVVALIVFLVWALQFAPRARVILSARTTDISVNQQVAIAPSATTSAENSTIRGERKTSTEEISIEFDVSGEREVGERAKGTVEFSTDSNSTLLRSPTIPAGTELTSSSGAVYTTDTDVSLNVFNQSGSTGITAAERGEEYNGATGSMSGAPERINATITSATAGGTSETVPVVTQADITGAREQLADRVDSDTAKQTLAREFEGEFVVIAESFETETGDIEPTVAAGSVARSGKAELKGEVEYSMFGIAKEELEKYLTEVVESQIDDAEQQRVYALGTDEVAFSDVTTNQQGVAAQMATEAQIGPNIEDGRVREIAAGKNYGEIQQELEAINGVDSVDIEFSPFWVSRAPANTDKITVEFLLDEQ